MIYFPKDILKNIFSYFDPFTLGMAEKVCSRFRNIISQEKIWREAVFEGVPVMEKTRFYRYIGDLNGIYYNDPKVKSIKIAGQVYSVKKAASYLLIIKYDEILFFKQWNQVRTAPIMRPQLVKIDGSQIAWLDSKGAVFILDGLEDRIKEIQLGLKVLKISLRADRLLCHYENSRLELIDLGGRRITAFEKVHKVKVYNFEYFVVWVQSDLFKVSLKDGSVIQTIPFRNYESSLVFNNKWACNLDFFVCHEPFDHFQISAANWENRRFLTIESRRGMPDDFKVLGHLLFIHYIAPTFFVIWNLRTKRQVMKEFMGARKISFVGSYNHLMGIGVWPMEGRAELHLYDIRLHCMVRKIELNRLASISFKDGVIVEKKRQKIRVLKF